MDKAPEATRILIVDDEPPTVELLAEMLSVESYKIQAAASGPEALGLARRDPPDLVILDVRMPDMDGLEVCRHLKADARTGHVPILMVTGLTDVRDKEAGMAAGADDYVTKPVHRADLVARVRSLLRVSHVSQEMDRMLAYLQELEAARRSQARPAGSQEPPETLPKAPPGRDGEAPRVLIVDDDRFIRVMFSKLLEGAGYRALAVASAEEAYQAATRGVDVILLDVMMPDVSGLEALGRLREIAPEVPILIVTAFQSAPNAIAALRGGAFDFIVKGMKNEMLLNAVARAVERRRLTHENRRLMEELRARLDAALATPAGPPR
jgi:two-component system cell cycle response regulator